MHQVTGTEQNVFTEMGVPHTVTAISPCNMFPNGGTPRFWPKKSLSQSSPSVMFFLSRTVRFSLFPLFSLSNPFKSKEPSTSTYWSCSSYLCDVISLNATRQPRSQGPLSSYLEKVLWLRLVTCLLDFCSE